MRAAVFQGEGRLVIHDAEEPAIAAPDDVLVEVEACGICGSDVHVLDVPPGHPATPGTILGHEFVGRVAAVGPSVQGLSVGQRVVADPDPKCGSCESCRAGRPSNCTRIVALGVYRHGALARLVVAPAASVFPIADHVPAEVAAMVEPLACVVNGTNRAAVRPGESAVVFGAGAIGCLFVAVLKASGATPIVAVEPSTVRLPVVTRIGATAAVTPEEFTRRRAELLPNGADVVVDAVGSVLGEAIETAAMGGRIVLFGMNAQARPAIPQNEITRKGLSVLGTYITNFTFPAAIRLVESGQLDLLPIVTDILPLERTAEGIARIRSGEATKIVIRP
jgi:threonine dehydrogenase-like Zn-dependent dehydrogenase